MFPNHEINTSIIGEIQIDNSFKPAVFEFNHLIELPFEDIGVWTPEKNKYSKLVSRTSTKCLQLNHWKTFGILIKYAHALTSSFESLLNPTYNWLSDFDRSKSKESFIYPELDNWRHDNFKFNYDISEIYEKGEILNLSYFYDSSRLIEELYFNDQFFFAVQNIVSGIETHWYCQTCALTPPEYRKHSNLDFDKYYEIYALPRLEIAIVQATKAVEGLLGQPGKNHERRIKRWNEILDIPPDSQFLDSSYSYFEFHEYLVYDLRNNVAHNIKNKPFKTNRDLTIQAQLYAWKIINNYYGKIVKEDPDITRLKMNNDLKQRLKPEIRSIETK